MWPPCTYPHCSMSYFVVCGAFSWSLLVQLEWATRAFISGIYKDPGQFSANLQSSITEYMKSVNSFMKWNDFYKACEFSHGSKGAPAWESHTGTRLVSPATGCQKKKRHLWSRASEHKIEYIRNIIRSTDAMETGTAPEKPLKAESRWKKRKEKKRHIPWRSFHIWIFFSCIISQCLSKTLSCLIAIYD